MNGVSDVDDLLIERDVELSKSFRVSRVLGSYDVPEDVATTMRMRVRMPLHEHSWTVGAVVGASGSGKSTIAREMWPDALYDASAKAREQLAVVDEFPEYMSAKDVTTTLSSVGLSSVPAWVRPYNVLSTGQKHRVDVALALTENPNSTVVFDEYTSTVDRYVAKAMSVAVAKYVRKREQQFVAVTCHKDIVDWLQPDWVYDTDTNEFEWRSVQSRPSIELRVCEGVHEAWRLFRDHHYLSSDLSKSSQVFLGYATVDGEERLVAFQAVIASMGHKGWRRSHRLVVHPDVQGLGIGMQFSEQVAEILWNQRGQRFRETTSHPAIVAYRKKHPNKWVMTFAPGHKPKHTSKAVTTSSSARLTTSWEYLPESLRGVAKPKSSRQRRRSKKRQP